MSTSALRTIERELRELERRRRDLDSAIARLRRIAVWLRRRLASRPAGRVGRADQGADAASHSLTDGCRAVLKMSGAEGLTPLEIKHHLTLSGLSWERFSNPMSAVHTVLKRLVAQHEAVATIGPDGRRRYAAKPILVIALSRRDLDDEDFVRKLLGVGSNEAVLDLLKRRK